MMTSIERRKTAYQAFVEKQGGLGDNWAMVMSFERRKAAYQAFVENRRDR
jgi:hypothetical protein